MKNKLRPGKLVIIMMTVLLLGTGYPISALAAVNVPDLNKTGSISVTLMDKKNDRNVTDGELTLYKVASAVSEDGSYTYAYVNGWEGCGIPLENLEDSELAGKLESRLPDTEKGITKALDTKGSVVYTDLSAGLYLLVQTKTSAGYEKIESFLVSVPLNMDGEWVYDVDASPKVGNVTASKPDTPTSDTPKTSAKSLQVGNRLPQTGQLDWPIPVLSIVGLLLFSAGWMLRRSEKDS